jgi:hypothetical protein
MFTHCVFFWLKPEVTAPQRASFERGLASLLGISSVVRGSFGVPAATDRPVVERSYSYGLTVHFEGLAEHDAYQVDAIHHAFLEQCSQLWSRVQVYDFVEPVDAKK